MFYDVPQFILVFLLAFLRWIELDIVRVSNKTHDVFESETAVSLGFKIVGSTDHFQTNRALNA